MLHALLHELTISQSQLGCYELDNEDVGTCQAESSQQLPGSVNMQLPITCLQLLVALTQHCSEAKSLLVQGADRSAS